MVSLLSLVRFPPGGRINTASFAASRVKLSIVIEGARRLKGHVLEILAYIFAHIATFVAIGIIFTGTATSAQESHEHMNGTEMRRKHDEKMMPKSSLKIISPKVVKDCVPGPHGARDLAIEPFRKN